MYLQLWDSVSGKCVATLVGHKEEVLDVCFDLSGQLIATASADGAYYSIFLCRQTNSLCYLGFFSNFIQQLYIVLITCKVLQMF